MATNDTIERAAQRVEAELKQLVSTINDEVVPAVRVEGGKTLRRIADALARLADSIERTTPPR